MSRRSIATASAVAIVILAVAFAHAGPADYLMPVDKHSTAKGRALAAKYRPQLLEFSDYVYHCLPYLEIRNGLGFKPMLSRMAALHGIDADPDVYGYAVQVEWIKPGSNPNVPTMEILSVFADKASTKAFLNKTLAPADYVQGAKLKFFDGDKDVGRLPIEIWDDNFTSTYKVPGYELEKGKVCS
jgi:hypothetical protein